MTPGLEDVKLNKSVGKSPLQGITWLVYNLFMLVRGALVQLGARNTGSVEVTGSSPVSSTIFMYRPLLFVILVLLLTLPCLGQSKGQAQPQQDKYVPDVVIVVFSGLLPTDSVSCTYNTGLTEKDARGDLQILANTLGSNFTDVRISTKALEPSNEKQTSSEFQASGLVDYKQGGFKIEPFITTFKRFKNIEINYIVNSNQFTFRGLRDYDDKYVSIRLSQPYRYRILVKNTQFADLNLPVAVASPTKTEVKSVGFRWTSILVALVLAIAAGALVYMGAAKLSKTTK